MEETMVERVAKAIDPMPWSDLAHDTWRAGGVHKAKQRALDQARAAIEAMREPTEAMCAAGSEAHGVWGFGAADALHVFNAMIDSALSSSTRGE